MPKLKSKSEQDVLVDRFWELMEPDLDAYSKWLDRLLREIPVTRLREIVHGIDEVTVKEFKVATVSESRNSFGLRGMILVARDGEAWEVAVSGLYEKKKGEMVKVEVKDDEIQASSSFFFEIPERKKPAPPGVVKEVWGE